MPDLLEYDPQVLNLPDTVGESFTASVRLGGAMQTLLLEPYTLRADDFRLLVQGEDGQLKAVTPVAERTYRGIIQGHTNTQVAASLIDGQLWATIALESGQVWSVQPLSDLTDLAVPTTSHAIYLDEDILPTDGTCGTDEIPQPLANVDDSAGSGGNPTSFGTGLFSTDIAFDADFEFFNANGGSVVSTMLDIESVMNTTEFVYERDTNITYEITVIVVRTTSADPYSSFIASTMLCEFRNT